MAYVHEQNPLYGSSVYSCCILR